MISPFDYLLGFRFFLRFAIMAEPQPDEKANNLYLSE
jgi:hypothetical protein